MALRMGFPSPFLGSRRWLASGPADPPFRGERRVNTVTDYFVHVADEDLLDSLGGPIAKLISGAWPWP